MLPGLEICPVCSRDFVQPVSWESVDNERWWMFLRCGDCGYSREVLVTNDEAQRFEAVLGSLASVLAREARRLDGERFETEAKAFFTALELDLINPDDFSH